ncbi:MAG: hypothetical protein WBM69_14470 [Desulfobacterales bacterium]
MLTYWQYAALFLLLAPCQRTRSKGLEISLLGRSSIRVIRYWLNGFVASVDAGDAADSNKKKALKFFRNGKQAAPDIKNRLKS